MVAQFCVDISEGTSAQGSLRNCGLVGRTRLEPHPPFLPSNLGPPYFFQGAAVDGGKLDLEDAEAKLKEENKNLKTDLKKLKDELASTKQSEGCLLCSPPLRSLEAVLSAAACFVPKYS